MKKNKHSLKISRSYGDITLDGYPIATYSNDELKILKNLLEKVLCEVNEYIFIFRQVKRMAQKEFRKPPRYMVGDIVYSHGFICIVCSIYPFNIDYSYDLKVIDGQSLGKICQNDIMHVHIWEEFLKKNGWTCYRSEGECFGHRWYKHQEYPFTLRYNNFLGICGVSFNDGKDDTVMIKGVDELQHILFGLQLDSNLKI